MTTETSGVSDVLAMTGAGARSLLTLFIGVSVILAVANLSDVYSPIPTIIALVIISAAATMLTLPAAEPFPLSRSLALLAVVAVSTVLVDWNIPPESTPLYATWHFGANTLILLFLGLRGRSGLAWVGFAAMTAITAVWTAGTGSFLLIELLPNQAGTLVVGTLFAIGLRSTSRRITALHAEQAAIAAAESATRAAASERSIQAAHLNEVARPALERIARGAPFTDDERESWMRLEASVRDSLRAPGLNVLELVAAADSARSRGVEVTLLDDSAGGLDSVADREAVTSAIIAELGTMDSGRLIGRVLPQGRGKLATIVIDEGDGSRHIDVG